MFFLFHMTIILGNALCGVRKALLWMGWAALSNTLSSLEFRKFPLLQRSWNRQLQRPFAMQDYTSNPPALQFGLSILRSPLQEWNWQVYRWSQAFYYEDDRRKDQVRGRRGCNQIISQSYPTTPSRIVTRDFSMAFWGTRGLCMDARSCVFFVETFSSSHTEALGQGHCATF